MNIGKLIKNNKGITLIEILVAMMIFGFVVGGIVIFGVRALEAHTKSQAMQNSLENARFAIESLSKRARTSHDIIQENPSGSDIFFIDNASGNSYCYKFASNALIVGIGDGETTEKCSDITSGFSDVVGDSANSSDIKVTGSFETESTDESAGDRGMLMINLTIEYTGNMGVQSNSTQTIQSTVSLRDY